MVCRSIIPISIILTLGPNHWFVKFLVSWMMWMTDLDRGRPYYFISRTQLGFDEDFCKVFYFQTRQGFEIFLPIHNIRFWSDGSRIVFWFFQRNPFLNYIDRKISSVWWHP